jgi:hypothetical protein
LIGSNVVKTFFDCSMTSDLMHERISCRPRFFRRTLLQHSARVAKPAKHGKLTGRAGVIVALIKEVCSQVSTALLRHFLIGGAH